VLHGGGTPNPPGFPQFSSKVLDPEKWQFFVLLRNATLTYPEEPSLKVEEDEEPFQKRAGALQSYHFREKPTKKSSQTFQIPFLVTSWV